MRTGLRFFYRHIYVTGIEHIPAHGPVIIIANHPSSLMDAALLGVLLKRRPWYFTRGDVFINRPVRKLLSWLHMIPVHQHEKGRSSINANDSSFLEARAILGNKGIIVFFPESTSHTEHRLWPFRKGVFRLAFQTMADHGFSLRLPIVPIGITYDHPTTGRHCVQVHAGPPLQMEDYTALYQSNPSAALLRIVKNAQDRMANEVLHIDDADKCLVTGECLALYRNDHPPRSQPWTITSRDRLRKEQAICRFMNGADEKTFLAIKKKNTAYFDALKQYGLDDRTVAGWVVPALRQAQDHTHPDQWKRLLLWAGFPLYLSGMALNGLPVWIARRIADKKVTRDDFYSWIFVSACCLLYFVWMMALLATAFFFGWQYPILLIPAMVLTGLFSYYYIDWRRQARQYKILRRLSREQLMQLKDRRRAISPWL